MKYFCFVKYELLSLILFPLLLFGQRDLYYRQFTTDNGLKSNTIYEVFQNTNGLMLVGHEKGISTYNGIAFRHFNIPSNSNASGNFIQLTKDKILFRNFMGNVFAYNNTKVSPQLSGIHIDWGYPTFISDKVNIYAYQSDQLFEVDSKGQFHRKKLEGLSTISRYWTVHVRNDTLFAIIVKKDKTYFLSYDLQKNKPIYQEYIPESRKSVLYTCGNESICVERKSLKFRKIKNGIPEDKSFTPEGITSKSKINFISKDSEQHYIIGTFDGLYVYDKSFQLIGHFLKGFQISCFYEDIENNYWFGSLQNGIFIVPSLHVFLLRSSELPGVNTKISCSYPLGNDKIILGTYNGKLHIVNQKGEIEKTIDLQKNAEIQSIYYDTKKRCLSVYCENLLTIQLPEWKIISSLPNTATKCMTTFDGKFVYGTSKGLYIPELSPGLIADSLWIKAVFFVTKNELLLETGKGLKTFNLISKKIQNFYPQGQTSACNLVNVNGKQYFRIENTIYQYIHKHQIRLVQTLKEPIERLFTDGKGLIVHTSNGKLISILHPQQIRLSRSTGLFQKDIDFIYNLNGVLVLVNTSSVQWFESIPAQNNLKPKIVTDGVAGSYIFNHGIWTSDYKNNELEIAFHLLPNVRSLGNDKMYYRIRGISNQWKTIEVNDSVYSLRLERLPFGTSTLEIKGVNESGIETAIFSMPLKIHPPFYFSWWFLILVLISITGTVWIFIKIRMGFINKRNLQRLEKERLKIKAIQAELAAIRSQMNPHFIFNSLSSIQSKILNEDKLQAYNNLSTFAKLLRQALHFSGREFISLEEELSFTDNYIDLELLRTNNGFCYVKQIDPTIDLKNTRIPSLLLQPFVENSIRHGIQHSEYDKALFVRVFRQSEALRIEIEDNGIGREKSMELNRVQRTGHESFATKAISERLEMLRSSGKTDVQIEIKDLSRGTRVILLISDIAIKGNNSIQSL